MQERHATFFSVVNIFIELSLYTAAVKFLEWDFFYFKNVSFFFQKRNKVVRGFEPGPMIMSQPTKPLY